MAALSWKTVVARMDAEVKEESTVARAALATAARKADYAMRVARLVEKKRRAAGQELAARFAAAATAEGERIKAEEREMEKGRLEWWSSAEGKKRNMEQEAKCAARTAKAARAASEVVVVEPPSRELLEGLGFD